ncbi:MAG: hypothetical protein CMH54_12535 [Myxococcales bacterium]|nr:hypothetical protein [Myxococcales bacterium]|tara:strand:+ start:532 stop:1122 length:591 start_codon:yes stop_codon:yes gene_type:complete
MFMSSLSVSSADDSRIKSLAEVSNAKLVKKMKQLVDEMRSELSKAFETLEKQRKKKDLMRMNAIQSVLVSMKGLVRLSEQTLMRGSEASARGKREQVEHAYITIRVARDKMQELILQMRSTSGGNQYTNDDLGESEVEILNKPITIIGPKYAWDGSPITEASATPGVDPSNPPDESPIWEITDPSYKRPQTTSPLL